jgi:hypothetical protein
MANERMALEVLSTIGDCSVELGHHSICEDPEVSSAFWGPSWLGVCFSPVGEVFESSLGSSSCFVIRILSGNRVKAMLELTIALLNERSLFAIARFLQPHHRISELQPFSLRKKRLELRGRLYLVNQFDVCHPHAEDIGLPNPLRGKSPNQTLDPFVQTRD